jgi:hypothetical protein
VLFDASVAISPNAPFQDSMKRTAVGIWRCGACKKTVAGGAWTVSTTAAATVRRCADHFIFAPDDTDILCPLAQFVVYAN